MNLNVALSTNPVEHTFVIVANLYIITFISPLCDGKHTKN